MITCRPSSVVVRPSTPLNAFSSEIPRPVFFKLHMEPSVKGGLKICTNGHVPLIMPKYGKKKTLNLLLLNQESLKAESWYIALWSQDQPCSNDDPMTFYGKVKFASPCICIGKMLKSHFLKMYLIRMAETYNE